MSDLQKQQEHEKRKHNNMAEQKKDTTDTSKSNAPTGDERNYINSVDWDRLQGVEIGGQNPILEVEAGEVAGPFTYAGHQSMQTDSGDVTVHLGENNGVIYRLPIAASFIRSVDQAGIGAGDQFALRRNDDQEKKRGVGKGQMMQIFSLKVIKKADKA
jgi:hypothetical protein